MANKPADKKEGAKTENGGALAAAAGFALPFVLLFASLIAAYALHPFIASAFMLTSAVALFIYARGAMSQTIRIVDYSVAFACLLLIVALPSGEIGIKPCPDTIAGAGKYVNVSYFYSPYCPNCPDAEKEIEAARKSGGDFTLLKYDIRYCRAAADRYGFSATPCFAAEGEKGVSKACGKWDAEDIKRIADSVR